VVKITPSILSANFARLEDDIRAAEEGRADLLHIDVMDGHFVPNITIGPMVQKAIRPLTKLPFDTHLMISEPDKYLEAFVDAGSDYLVVHAEVCHHLHRTLTHIRKLGIKCGVSLNPSTPLESVRHVIDDMDLLLIMTVNPGFGGQKFIPTVVPKIAEARKLIGDREIELQVDGGIVPENAGQVVAAGATMLVAGSAVFKGKGTIAENIAAIRRAAEG
jgi:ribulose-phosphate 3-epimerase